MARTAHWRWLLPLLVLLLSTARAGAQTLFTETFEGTNGFTVVNGAATNAWSVGTPPGNGPTTPGASAAFISNDAGVTHVFSTGTISVVHMYRDVTFPAGQEAIVLSLDWRGLGESSALYDNLQLFLIPTSVTPVASNTGALAANSRLQNSGHVPFATLTGQAAYSSSKILLPASAAGTTQRLVFQWYNDGSGGTNPPAAFDNVVLTSRVTAPLSGTYTINNTQPTNGATLNFNNFTDAIISLNADGISGPVTFNVSSGQTFIENPPAIVATGTAAFPIVFQKTAGTNPVLQVSGGAAAIDLVGGDFFTFTGIDVAAGTTGPTYGYRIRNASATDGAFNNTVQNASIALVRTTSTSGAGLIQTSNSTGGGVAATATSGVNQNNRYLNLTIGSAYNGIWLFGTSTSFADVNTEVANCTVGNPAVPGDIGNGNGTTTTTAYGIRSVLQSQQSIHDNTVTNVYAATTAYGMSIEQSFGTGTNSGKVFNNRVSGVRSNVTSTTSTVVAYGIRADVATSGGPHTLNVYNNFIWDITHGRTGTTATATRIIRGLNVQNAGSGSGSFINVYYNSVRIDGSGSPSGSNTCFEVGTASGPVYDVRNNVFANFTGTQAGGKHYAWISTSTTLLGAAGSVSDYNDLFVAGGTGDATRGYVGAMGTPSTTAPSTVDKAALADWQAASSQDANSIGTDPLFVSATDLHLQATSLAKGAARALAAVTTDIDGETRKPLPDMGGDEIPASGTDVAATAINGPAPVFSAGPLPVTVTIANVGLAAITAVQVSYVFNGSATNLGSLTLAAPLTAGASTTVPLGSLTFIDDANTLTVTVTTTGDTDASNNTQGPQTFRPGLNGAYTINSAQATAGRNFTSFTDAATALNAAGVAGPVTFAVSNGPYTEQISLDAIAGASATNTVVFNGNGRTLQFGSNDSNQRAVVRLNGADFVTFDNLLIDATVGGTATATYGWGVQLINGADNNRILNSTITSSTTSSSSNFNGIVASGSNTSATTAGNAANFLTVQGSTVVGGYYGIILNGTSTTVLAGAHQLRTNTVRDFYFTGIDVENNDGAQIIGNDIHRATRTTAVTTFQGIYIAGNTINADIEQNRIHDTFTATSSTSGTAYGIYFSSNDATAATANEVVNNLIYNFNSPNGIEYGLYNLGSDYVSYYHNTVALTNGGASTTSLTAGFYQSTSAVGIELLNNLFSVTRNTAGTGGKYALFFNLSSTTATASTITSNENDLHIGAGTNFFTGHTGLATGGSDYATLLDWQTGTSQDATSVQIDPGFDATFKPTRLALDNLATVLARVTNDIAAAPRSSTPDMGAYEFTGAACGTVSTLTAANVTSASADITFGAGLGNTDYTVTVNNGTATTTVTPGPIASPVLLTGLTPGLEYTVTVTSNCGSGQTSSASTVTFTTRVANDECANAVVLTPGAAGAGCTAPTSGTTFNAGSSLAAAPCTGTADDDVFYSFVATATQHSIVVAEGTGFDGVIDLRSGACNGTNLLCQDLSASGGTETLVATGLTVGDTYLVRLYSFTATTPTPTNSTFTICITTPAACEAPTTVAVNTITATSANVTFVAGFGAATYTVTATPASGPAVTASGAGSPIALTGLVGSTQYSVAVTSNCGGGATATSSPAVSFTTTLINDNPSGAIAVPLTADCASPTQGTTVAATTTPVNGYANPGTAPNSCGIASSPDDVWYTFTTAATGPASTSVIVTVTGNPAGQIRAFASTNGAAGPFAQVGCSASGTVNTVAPPLTLSGLTASTTYFVRIAGYGSSDTQGAFTICVTGPPAVCNAPTALATANVTQNTADVTFTAGTGNTSFTATATPQGGGPTIVGTGTGSPLALAGLTAGLTYDLSLQAVCAAGGTTAAVTTTFGTPAAPVCAAPGTPGFAAVTTTSASVSFTPSSTNVGPYTVTATAGAATVTATGTASPISLTGLAFGTTYSVTVTGTCTAASGGGTSPASAAASLTTATPPCDAPTALVLSSITANSATVSFTASASATDYTVTTSPATTTQTVTGTTANLTGLSASTAYTVNVTSNCAGGLTATATASFTTASPALTDLVVSTMQTIQGAYNNVTVTGTGVATLSGTLTVNGTLAVQTGGVLVQACQLINGPGSFVLAAGASLAICDPAGIATTGAVGAVQVTGSRSFSSDANYAYNGVVPQVTGPGLPSRVLNLGVSNATGLSLSQAVSVTQVARLENGNLTTAGQGFTLLSSATGTALVDNRGGIVVGTATVQRYIDPTLNAGPGYRHYSAPVANTTLADLATGGFSPVVNAAYNTLGNTVSPFPTVFGYEQGRVLTSGNAGSLDFDKGFFSPTTAADAMAVGRGYTVNIGASELVDFRGTLNTGAVSTGPLARGAQTESGWHFLGNPYPAPLDWSTVTVPADLNSAMYVFQSTGQYAGSYRSYQNGVGGNPLIASSQGFFVRVATAGATPSLTLTNANRVTTFTGANPAFNRGTADARPLVQLTVNGATSPAALADDAYVYFEPGATAGVDARYDAFKIRNSGAAASLYALAGNEELSISGLAPLTALDVVVPLGLAVPQAGTYVLNAAELRNFARGTEVYLRDAQTGLFQNLVQQPRYSFAVAAGALGSTTRFSLVFRSSNVTGVRAELQAAQLDVYPNPARTAFTLNIPAVLTAKTVSAVLCNALGQTVQERTLPVTSTGVQARFDVSNLATGVYLLRVTAGGTLVTKRVVVE